MNQRIIIGTVVWGEEYIDNFLKYGISSLIFEQEKGSEIEVKFIVVTSSNSREYLENALTQINWPIKFSWQIIESGALSTTFILEKNLGIQVNKYILHSHGFNLILKNLKDGDIYVSNYGDFAWSDNAIIKILEILGDNKFDLITCHPVTMGENSLAEMDLMRDKNERLKLNPSKLIEISLKTATWWYNQYTWGSSKASNYLSLIYWKIAENMYLFRGFHIHPLAFKFRNSKGQTLPKIEFGTLDGHYFPLVLVKDGWNDYFVNDLKEICVATWTSKTKSDYFQNEENFNSRLKRHIQNSHVQSEISNLEKYVLIGNSNSDISKILEISRFNLERTLSKIQMREVVGNEEELHKELQFVEKIESIKRLKLIILLIQLQIFRLVILVLLRPYFLMIRKGINIKRVIVRLKANFILKNAITRFEIIQIFQKRLGFDFFLPNSKIEQYKQEIGLRIYDLNKDFHESDSFEAVKINPPNEIQNKERFEDKVDKRNGILKKYLISLQAKSELLRHYKKRLQD